MNFGSVAPSVYGQSNKTLSFFENRVWCSFYENGLLSFSYCTNGESSREFFNNKNSYQVHCNDNILISKDNSSFCILN
ncbi:hypothetical protein MF1_03530 [Bartonella quintana]|nr:hypothetical protein MF1_03530 [Bartonella quintana]